MLYPDHKPTRLVGIEPEEQTKKKKNSSYFDMPKSAIGRLKRENFDKYQSVKYEHPMVIFIRKIRVCFLIKLELLFLLNLIIKLIKLKK